MFELSIEEVVAESNLELFTRVDGFKIELFQRDSNSAALRFTDDQGQEIASFPWWCQRFSNPDPAWVFES